MISSSAMSPGGTAPAGPVAPAIMRIGAARMTAGLDRYPRLDLEAHRDLFGRLPRLSEAERPGRSPTIMHTMSGRNISPRWSSILTRALRMKIGFRSR